MLQQCMRGEKDKPLLPRLGPEVKDVFSILLKTSEGRAGKLDLKNVITHAVVRRAVVLKFLLGAIKRKSRPCQH